MSQEEETTTFSRTIKPWSQFFSITSISFPSSFSNLTTRLTQNLSYFKLNYIHLSLTIFFISLFFHPLSLFILFLTALGWYFLYFREDPLEFHGFTVGDRVVGVVLGIVTVVALFYANVWLNLFVSICVSVLVIVFHGVFMGSSFGDDDSSYGGGLLDAQDGGYSQL